MIIPVRGLSEGKSRLSAVLSPDRRRELNAFLFEHTVHAVRDAFAGLQQCIVISTCEATLGLANKMGVFPLEEPAAAGLNRALDFARSYAKSKNAARILILPCDLPLLTGDVLRSAVDDAGEGPAVTIFPDRRKTGTNAIVLPAVLDFRFAFGRRSYQAHADEAARLGVRVEIRRIPEIAFDVDEAEDLEEWRGLAGSLTR